MYISGLNDITDITGFYNKSEGVNFMYTSQWKLRDLHYGQG